jgi:glycosyltransferase involved in cell wall biosynthesis
MVNVKWTKKILDAAGLEIISRKHPIDSRTKDGIPREAILARLECEIDYTKRIYKKLEDEDKAAEEQLLKIGKETPQTQTANTAAGQPAETETPYPEIPPGMIAVSIIVPAYNEAPRIRRCLYSLINQTLKEIEIIAADNGSTDGTGKILDEYAAKDKRVRVIHLPPPNAGISKGWNAGLAAAKGEYLAFVCGDDSIDLEFCEKLYARAAATGADIVKGVGLALNGDSPPSPQQLAILKNNPAIFYQNNIIKQHHAYFNSMWPSAIYKRDLVEKNNIHITDHLNSDIFFIVKAVTCMTNGIEIVNDAFYNYFKRAGSADSAKYDNQKTENQISGSRLIIDYINSVDIDPETYSIFFKREITTLLGYIFNKAPDDAARRAVVEGVMDLFKRCKHQEGCKDLSYFGYLLYGDVDGMLALLPKPKAVDGGGG